MLSAERFGGAPSGRIGFAEPGEEEREAQDHARAADDLSEHIAGVGCSQLLYEIHKDHREHDDRGIADPVLFKRFPLADGRTVGFHDDGLGYRGGRRTGTKIIKSSPQNFILQKDVLPPL